MHCQCGVLCCLSLSLVILQNLHNWGVRITACLRKYDHMSHHHHQLNWLSVSSLIKYCSLCIMHKIYYHNNVPLSPPIVFGSDHTYRTQWSERLIWPEYCRLLAIQKLFWHMAVCWWNDLSDDTATSFVFSLTIFLVKICMIILRVLYIFLCNVAYACILVFVSMSCMLYVNIVMHLMFVFVCMFLYALVWKNSSTKYWS